MGLWGQIFLPATPILSHFGHFNGVKIFFCFLFKTISQRGASDMLT